MSRRSRLMIVLLAVVSMSGGATSGVYLGRLQDGRKLAARPAPTSLVPRYGIEPTQPGGKAQVTVEASGRTADGQTVTSNRVTGQPR